jgi:AraC family transcriptional regulator, regulatory protein of adaptative response / DNA-3-methyladenine glycosylase II
MRGVSAVVTTGIYCRPGCGARPLATNVQQFPVAAAAEAAGYRACLRCRPYRNPTVVDWSGPELVCRAIQLILDGILDLGTEEMLAGRLSVSPRHLRRMFVDHVGVTPHGLARSARAHFARRLLDDTDLSLTEIAFAAGFGSLRQFNRVLQDVFQATPRDLRAKRRKSDRLVADGGLTLRLGFEGDLDWPVVCGYLADVGFPGVEHVDGDIYRRTIVIGGDAGVLELYPGGEDYLVLRLHLPHWEELIHVVHRARRIASLDSDLDGPLRQLVADPVVGSLVRTRPGVRVPGTWDAFEVGVWAIVARHAVDAAVDDVTGCLVKRHGTPVAGLEQLGLTHTFPGPDVLATADLTGLGLAQSQIVAIHELSRSIADGRVQLDRSVGLDQFVASVEALNGIDEHAAHYLAFRLGEPDAFPLTIATSRRRIHPVQATNGVPAAVAKGWRPWRALAVTHLWTDARTKEADQSHPSSVSS